MLKKVYSIYDEKACFFSAPYVSTNDLTALRSFSQVATDPHTEIHRFPTDYSLYEIGTFDDFTGVMTPLQAAINHGKANQFNSPEV